MAVKTVLQGRHVQILTDNVSASAYINHKGGPSTDLPQLAVAVWSLATEYGLTLFCRQVAGVSNTKADRLS